MEYIQLTLNDWVQMKQKLQAELLGVRRSFVRIGYILRKIDDAKGYENDGYKSITEWAKGEYGLEGSTVSRFMAINREYSVGGYSEDLLPEFEDFKRSQLEEMLKLPAEDRSMIVPETPRADIRELKAFNKQKVEGVADDIEAFLEKFLEDNWELAVELEGVAGDVEQTKEAMIPSGNKSYKKGLFFLMANEEKVSIKKYGATPKDYTWQQFTDLLSDIFEERNQREDEERKRQEQSKEEEHGKQEVRGTDREDQQEAPGMEKETEEITIQEPEKEESKPEDEPEEEARIKEVEPEVAIEEPTPVAPAQNSLQRQEETEISKEEKAPQEESFGNRKQYMETLTEYGLADYLVKEYAKRRLKLEFLENKASMQAYLEQEVDEYGEPLEEEEK